MDLTLLTVRPRRRRSRRRGGGGGGGGGRGGGRGGLNDQTLANIMQKVNAKLGGINMLVSPGQELRPSQLFSKATIIFGGDVSHASPGSQASSIAALVGNTNRSCTQYVARLSAQANRKEMIDDLKSMAREIMIEYFNANGGASNPESRPERVLFYRDGVSESQFQAVLSDELPCLRQAFQSLGDGSYNPTITYIVAQKRHNTRLFVSNPQDGEGRNKDVPAGTVVDTGRAVSLPFILECRVTTGSAELLAARVPVLASFRGRALGLTVWTRSLSG
jgi:eukaryotic translation initiation factor 2C